MPPLNQEIRERFSLGPAYHMTHVQNLESILQAKALYSFNRMQKETSYRRIDNEEVQKGRAKITVPASGLPLHDYVPLYFGFKTPMVMVNKELNESLIFIRYSLDILTTPGVVVSDGNARSNETQFWLYTGIDVLENLDVKAISTVRYAGQNDVKRKKQAELLVPNSLKIHRALDIICFSESSKSTVSAALKKYGISIAVQINPGWYYRPEVGKQI